MHRKVILGAHGRVWAPWVAVIALVRVSSAEAQPAEAPPPPATAPTAPGTTTTSPSVSPEPVPPSPGTSADVIATAPVPAPSPVTSEAATTSSSELPTEPVAAEASAEASDEPEQQLNTVVVTAQRREESIQDVPAPVSVLGGDNIIDTGIGKSAKEVLDYVPNASAVAQGHGRPRWWIRGVGTGQQQLDFSNPVGFYLDDVFISNATGTGFPLFDLDRVEILRGPQGTLWGKNTTGGAINIISRKPEFTPDGYFKVDFGRFQSSIYEGAFGGAVLGEKVAARASFHYEDHGGRFRNADTRRREGQLTDGAGRLQLLWKITPKVEALANVHVRKYTTNGTNQTVTGTGPNGEYLAGYRPSKDPLVVATNAPSSSDISQTGALLNVKAELGDFALTSISGWESFRTNSLTDSDYTPLEINRGWNRAGSYQFSEELRLASPREDRINWIAGLYGLLENIESETASARLPGVAQALPGPSNYSFTEYEHDTQTGAVFASVTGNITEALSITGGLRFTVEHRTLELSRYQSTGAQFSNVARWWEPTSVTTPFDSQFSVDPDETWSNWTGDITPQYKINDDALVFFRYAHGVKSGGFNTAATSPAAFNVVQPESLDNFELGAKTSFLNKRLTLNPSAFYYIYKDIQINVVGPLPPTNVAVSYLQNVERGRAFGAELELEGRPTDNVQITGSLGLLDTEFTDFVVRNGGPDNSGNSFVRSPAVTTLLRGNWEIPFPGDRSPILHLSGDWRYQSRQVHFTTNQDNPLLQTAPFSIVNLRVSLKSHDEELILTGYVNNVLDEQFIAHSLPGAQGATGAVTIWGDPLTVGAWLTARWY